MLTDRWLEKSNFIFHNLQRCPKDEDTFSSTSFFKKFFQWKVPAYYNDFLFSGEPVKLINLLGQNCLIGFRFFPVRDILLRFISSNLIFSTLMSWICPILKYTTMDSRSIVLHIFGRWNFFPVRYYRNNFKDGFHIEKKFFYSPVFAVNFKMILYLH